MADQLTDHLMHARQELIQARRLVNERPDRVGRHRVCTNPAHANAPIRCRKPLTPPFVIADQRTAQKAARQGSPRIFAAHGGR